MKQKRIHKMHAVRKLAMLRYMETPQASTDMAVELDIPLQSVQKYLRQMKESGHVEVIEGERTFPRGLYTTYKATGLPLDEPSSSKVKYNRGFTFMGVRF